MISCLGQGDTRSNIQYDFVSHSRRQSDRAKSVSSLKSSRPRLSSGHDFPPAVQKNTSTCTRLVTVPSHDTVIRLSVGLSMSAVSISDRREIQVFSQNSPQADVIQFLNLGREEERGGDYAGGMRQLASEESATLVPLLVLKSSCRESCPVLCK